MVACPLCPRAFVDTHALSQHRRDAVHCTKCTNCGHSFNSTDALSEHRKACHSFFCSQCGRKFLSAESLRQHCTSTGHTASKDGVQHQASSKIALPHLLSAVNASQFHCCDCDRDFSDQQALEQHLIHKVHRARSPKAAVTRKQVLKCSWSECKNREFATKMDLRQHLKSLAHKPLSDIQCPASRKCSRRFTSPSALLLHLESGACHSGLTRTRINELFIKYDTSRIISGGDSESLRTMTRTSDRSLTSSGILTPNTEATGDVSSLAMWTPSSSDVSRPASRAPSSAETLVTTTQALPYRCSLCHGRKSFGSVEALEAHISSPVHAPKIFHCPLALLQQLVQKGHKGVLKNFSTLSGLVQHLESGACAGGRETLRLAASAFEKRLRDAGLQQIRLLK